MIPIPLTAKYAETRIDTSLQRIVNMYPHTVEGYRQFPGLTVFTDQTVSAPTYTDLKSFTGAGADNTKSFAFKSDGSKCWWVNFTDGTIEEATPSVAWDVSTCPAQTSTALSYNGDPSPFALVIRPDTGTKAYILDNDGIIYQHTLSTPYDTTTISYDSVSFNTGSSRVAMEINSSGTKLYVNGTSAGLDPIVKQYSITSAWDLSGVTDDNIELVVGDFQQGRIHLTNSDTKLFITGVNISSAIEEYLVQDTTDISSAALLGTYNAPVGGQKKGGVFFGNSGNTLYIMDSARVYELAAGGAYTYGGATKTARGMQVMNNVLYAVFDTTLYSISADGTATSIGTIDGSARVVMDTDGTQLGIATGSSGNKIYQYTVSGGLVTVTDADVDDDANSLAYLDRRFYFAQGEQFKASQVDDLTSIDPLDFATAEAFDDNITRTFSLNRYLYHFGGSSLEAWYTSSGRPPVSRQTVIERGIIGTHAIDSLDNQIYFVDQFRRPNVMQGLEYVPIYTPGVARAWDSYVNIDDCIVTAYTWQQQGFVEFNFAAANKTWTYHVSSGEWVEREDSGNDGYDVVEYANIYGKTIGLANSYLYEMSESTYQDNEANITRTIHTGPITSRLWGLPHKDISIDALSLTIQATTSASVTVSFSADSGAASLDQTVTVNSGIDDYILSGWGDCREGIFKITTTSNAGVDIMSAHVQGEVFYD